MGRGRIRREMSKCLQINENENTMNKSTGYSKNSSKREVNNDKPHTLKKKKDIK